MSQENFVFRGTLDACFYHFRRQFRKRHPRARLGAVEAKLPLAKFCGAKDSAVTSWLNKDVLPSGKRYFKLMCFLQVQGYIVNEFHNLSATIRGLVELLGYDILTANQISQDIGFTHSAQLFHVFRGEGKLVNERSERGYALLKKHRPALKSKKEAVAKQRPYNFGAIIGAPLQHRALLGGMEALSYLLQSDIPKHEVDDLRTRLGNVPSDLCDQLNAFMAQLNTTEG